MELKIVEARPDMHEELKELHLAVTAIPGGQKIYSGPGKYETPLSMVWFNPGYRSG